MELQHRGVSRQRQWGARGIVSARRIIYPSMLMIQSPQGLAISRVKCTAAELQQEKHHHRGRWCSDTWRYGWH
jgi:hypothetical protein